MLDSLLNILIEGLKNNTNLGYFFSTILISEFIKLATNFNTETRKHTFRFDKKHRVKFKGRTLTLVVGLIIGLMEYFNMRAAGTLTQEITSQLSTTYLIIGVFYHFIYNILVVKTKSILGSISDSKITVTTESGTANVKMEEDTEIKPKRKRKNGTYSKVSGDE